MRPMEEGGWIAPLDRLGWTVKSSREMETEVGEPLDLLLDPPRIVVQAPRGLSLIHI